MKGLFLLTVSALLPAALHAQGNYTICDTTEFCICHDGSVATHTYVFNPCAPGLSLGMFFCGGDVPEGLFATVFNGPSSADPVYGTLGAPGPWDGEYYLSTHPSGALTLWLNYTTPSELSCQTGDYTPLVFWVAPFQWTPFPPQFDCSGAGSSCFPTVLGDRAGVAIPNVSYFEGCLQISGGGFIGVIELFDLGGRIIERKRVQGAERVPVRASLAPGLYVAVLRNGATASSHRIAIP
ncbi:MAG: T9SS type A sorting domain-containing protein [Flavobacteriales bacterium]|jgi:hypothetical protein